MRPLRVLVGCERHGRVAAAFRRRGHHAWSVDTAEGAGAHHIQDDVLNHLERAPDGHPWDLGIFFPDCTYLTTSAAWAFGDGPYHQKVKPGTLVGAERRAARQKAIDFVLRIASAPIPKRAIENPKGYLSGAFAIPDQIIQPFQFGHPESKATCLWLFNLPKLRPTAWAAPRIETLPLLGGTVSGRPRWNNQSDSGQNNLSEKPGRAMKRAETYPGIAEAMAEQWGGQAA
jgi:hypothetical protein